MGGDFGRARIGVLTQTLKPVIFSTGFGTIKNRVLIETQFSCGLEILSGFRKTHTPGLKPSILREGFSGFENPLPRTESPGLAPSHCWALSLFEVT